MEIKVAVVIDSHQATYSIYCNYQLCPSGPKVCVWSLEIGDVAGSLITKLVKSLVDCVVVYPNVLLSHDVNVVGRQEDY